MNIVFLLIVATLCVIHLAYCILIIYIIYINIQNPVSTTLPNPPQIMVSVLIIARNEAHNLHQLFANLIAQNYTTKNIEIIVVDDNSTDETLDIAKSYANQLTIHCIELKNYTNITSNYKKQAQALAVGHCTNDFVICIDADVQLTPNFIAAHVQHYTSNNHYFQYGLVTFNSNTTNLIQRIDYNENLALQALTRGAALSNNHLLCNGANMAFSKQAYTTLQVQSNSTTNASGDDVLLLQKFINAGYAVSYVNTTHAQVQHPTTTFLMHYLQQRARWFSKHASYTNTKLKYVMYCIGLQNIVQPLVQMSILMMCCILTFNLLTIYYLVMLLVITVLTKLIIDSALVHKFEQTTTSTITKLTLSFIWAAVVYPWYVWAVVLYTKFTPLRWKDRLIS